MKTKTNCGIVGNAVAFAILIVLFAVFCVASGSTLTSHQPPAQDFAVEARALARQLDAVAEQCEQGGELYQADGYRGMVKQMGRVLSRLGEFEIHR